MPETDDYLSIGEFAKRLGVSKTAVAKAIKSGRIERREGDLKIHWQSQSKAWHLGRDPSKVRNDFADEDDDESSEDIDDGGDAQLIAAKRRFLIAKADKEKALAGQKELDLALAKGEVVKTSHVLTVVAQLLIDIRDGVTTIADRSADEIAAAAGGAIPSEIVRRILKREARAVLQRISDAERGEFL